MDPNAALESIREITGRHDLGEDLDQYDADTLADLILGLDQWLSRGGALPKVWQQPAKGWQ